MVKISPTTMKNGLQTKSLKPALLLVEARAGVEPTYTDLQSRKRIMHEAGKAVKYRHAVCKIGDVRHLCYGLVKISPTQNAMTKTLSHRIPTNA